MPRTGHAIHFRKTRSVMKCLLPTGTPGPRVNLGLSHSVAKTALSGLNFRLPPVFYTLHPRRTLRRRLGLAAQLSFRDRYNCLCLINKEREGQRGTVTHPKCTVKLWQRRGSRQGRLWLLALLFFLPHGTFRSQKSLWAQRENGSLFSKRSSLVGGCHSTYALDLHRCIWPA